MCCFFLINLGYLYQIQYTVHELKISQPPASWNLPCISAVDVKYIWLFEKLGCSWSPDIHNRLVRFSASLMYSELLLRASQVALVVKNLPANAGDARDAGSVPGLGRSPGGGHGNPLQFSCLGNPMDKGAWQATARRVAKSRTELKWLSTHTCTSSC